MIKFDDSKGMSIEDISELETFSNFKLPKELKILFEKCSGGTVLNEKQYLFKSEFNDIETWIIELWTKDSIINNWNHRSYLQDYMKWYELTEENVEIDKLFPVFDMINGEIMVAIGGKFDKNVFFVDNDGEGILNVSKDIEEFCSKLILFSF